MRVMGIDNGSHVVGYAVLEDGALVTAGTIKSEAKDQGRRLAVIYEEFCKLLEDQKPDLVAIETPFINSKFMSAVIPLGHSRGVLVLALAQRNLKRLDVSPSEAKRAVGAKMKGKASVQEAVVRLLSLGSTPPPDVADAMALAVAAESHERADGTTGPSS